MSDAQMWHPTTRHCPTAVAGHGLDVKRAVLMPSTPARKSAGHGVSGAGGSRTHDLTVPQLADLTCFVVACDDVYWLVSEVSSSHASPLRAAVIGHKRVEKRGRGHGSDVPARASAFGHCRSSKPRRRGCGAHLGYGGGGAAGGVGGSARRGGGRDRGVDAARGRDIAATDGAHPGRRFGAAVCGLLDVPAVLPWRGCPGGCGRARCVALGPGCLPVGSDVGARRPMHRAGAPGC